MRRMERVRCRACRHHAGRGADAGVPVVSSRSDHVAGALLLATLAAVATGGSVGAVAGPAGAADREPSAATVPAGGAAVALAPEVASPPTRRRRGPRRPAARRAARPSRRGARPHRGPTRRGRTLRGGGPRATAGDRPRAHRARRSSRIPPDGRSPSSPRGGQRCPAGPLAAPARRGRGLLEIWYGLRPASHSPTTTPCGLTPRP